ncbi:putative bifunctional diguanylate cyclase/phosphodiesterase [Rhodoferax saidenbachensis]|uniref:Bifunctional diguanylate cyclase/phosphodiesterase n=1 Tax=Rhodoferax saidenbachensis TaxID=1484693 RepID=A0A1P8KB29_9BURK|nr:bifunctional diguanylate cyclase/phosphodiesterase [Rhodoferax saidenbachensis]APW43190.1 bifunctional diguanylate cyclase/phosphodiesterase [Rhodoferax saidenbachensis]
MQSALVDISYNQWLVALSFVIASFASYVALNLAKRVRSQDKSIARAWLVGGSVVMGTGIWSMHFIGMSAVSLPFAVGFDYIITALSWVAAVAVSAVALYVAGYSQLTISRLTMGSLAMGAGICTMHYTGMASLDMAPGIQWDWFLIAVSAAIAVTASAVALLIFFMLRDLTGSAERNWQLVAALVMGAAICGMHYTGMAAAGFSANSVCLSADQLSGDSLGLLVTVASSILLSITMFTSTLDARMQGKAEKLTASLKAANSELQQIAFRDALTGLPNRLLFDDRVNSAVERCRRDGTSLAMLFIDLDGFKPVNDSFGHRVGDEVLREIGRRLSLQLRATDTVARVGGDEFVLLREGAADSTAIAQMAQRLIDVISEPMTESGHDVRLSCSVGIALYPSDGPHEELMAHADAAMYSAKRTGGSGYAFFEPHMNAGVRQQIELQRDLRLAIERREFELHYQPKVNAGTSLITGVEALVRWRHPTRGMLSPVLFIPVAERFGLIGALGSWVIDEACRQVAAWSAQGMRMRVAINLSVHQLRQDDLAKRISAAIAQHKIDPVLLTFEITESVAMEDAESTLQMFEDLSRIGVKLSIDDFGTGYSSLSYLRRLRVGELKIDRSFVQDLEFSADARAIVEAVIGLAHVLGLKVVAEGVETAAQRDVLTRLHCDDLQGYLFAKPMTPEMMTKWVEGDDAPGTSWLAKLATTRPSPLT